MLDLATHKASKRMKLNKLISLLQADKASIHWVILTANVEVLWIKQIRGLTHVLASKIYEHLVCNKQIQVTMLAAIRGRA